MHRYFTIAEVLRNTDYFTAVLGKVASFQITNELWLPKILRTPFWFRQLTGNNPFRHNGKKYAVLKSWNGLPFYTTYGIAYFALDFLEEAVSQDDPFLLYITFQALHYSPLQTPEAAVRRLAGIFGAVSAKYRHTCGVKNRW